MRGIILRGKARAKVNFFLDVEGKRRDGYHDIITVMQQIAMSDDVEIEVRKGKGIEIKTNLPYLTVGKENTAYKAAKALCDMCGIDRMISISIKKNIPVSAGLAGGSSDAAAVLRLMNEGLSLGISEDGLMGEAKKIGADVPFCLMGKAALAEGIGEILTPVKGLEKGFLLLSKPNIAVSTARVYQALDLKEGGAGEGLLAAEALISEMGAGNLGGLSEKLYNRLEDVTIARHPIVGDIKKKMLQYGALGTLMSGSGPTVFGIFKDYDRTAKAYRNLKKTYENTYITVAYSKEERE